MLWFAKTALVLLVVTLPLMKPDLPVAGLPAVPADLLFLLAAAALAVAVVRGRARLRGDTIMPILLIYFAALLASIVVNGGGGGAFLKLATQLYLLSLPLLVLNLIESPRDLRRLCRAWLAGTAVVTAIALFALLAFASGNPGGIASPFLHEFGTLPPGGYPRIEATFRYPAMLCNYLTVSLAILLASRRLGWVQRRPFHLLLWPLLATAAFTLTPGLGGVLLMLTIWAFLTAHSGAARTAAALAGAGAAIAFLVAAAVTPILHPTAPFLIAIPGLDQPLAPSVRMMTWIDAAKAFVASPLFGSGLDGAAVEVSYVAPSGKHHLLTDAHNMFLNLAAQAGLAGLAALLLLIVHVARRIGPLRLRPGRELSLLLGLAWLNAFVYQGLTGSYEDARHLWLLLGLFLASRRIEQLALSRQQQREHYGSSAIRTG